MEQVKSSKKLLDLLKLVAFQVGSEVSLTELGSQLDLDKKTVARYLDLLEKTFILFNLRGYGRNLRKAVSKKSKYYFWDNGIRNAIINNFNLLDTRDGKLHGYEFKFKKLGVKPPKVWKETYKQADFKVINRDNYLDFIA